MKGSAPTAGAFFLCQTQTRLAQNQSPDLSPYLSGLYILLGGGEHATPTIELFKKGARHESEPIRQIRANPR